MPIQERAEESRTVERAYLPDALRFPGKRKPLYAVILALSHSL